jgi:chlorite dismutase
MKIQTSTETNAIQTTEREYLNYIFFKVDAQWRRLDNESKSAAKQEFVSITNRFGKQNMELRSSEASRYTALETPIFTCITMPVDEILNLLG